MSTYERKILLSNFLSKYDVFKMYPLKYSCHETLNKVENEKYCKRIKA